MNLTSLGLDTNLEILTTELAIANLMASLALGLSLMLLSIWAAKRISQIESNYVSPEVSKENSLIHFEQYKKISKITRLSTVEIILASSNVLFLCFGMAGIMILVNNSLARAFAIAAAIAVVRFRIKFDSQIMAATLFFGVLAGMACGVGQIPIAAFMTFCFIALHILLSLVIHRIKE